MNTKETNCCDGYVPRGLILQWHITNRCNLRCAHCYQDTYQGEEREFGDLLQILSHYQQLLSSWRKSGPRGGVKGHITVTGGEPFVRRDFVDLLHEFALRRSEFSFGILTNGTLINEETANCLAELRPGFVQVSVEGRRETHDRIRGRGNYDQVVAAIGRLVRAKVRTIISFTAHPQNFRDFPEVARLGCALGVSRVWTDRLIPSGAGKTMQEFLMSPEQTREYCGTITAARQEALRSRDHRTEIAAHRALQFLTSGSAAYHCTAGDSLLTIMPNGDVYPCRRMPVRVGNIFQIALREIYEQSPILCALRNRANLPPECGDCCFRNQCRGGLKCLSFVAHGDPFKADPGCWLAHPASKQENGPPLPQPALGSLNPVTTAGHSCFSSAYGP